MDFSQKTLLNVISAGIGRKDYFFGRVAVSLLLVFPLHVTALLVFIVGRLCFHSVEVERPELALFWVKWAACMICAAAQLWSYASVINMVCYFVKKQLAAMAIGLGLVLAELIAGQLADMYGIAFVSRIFGIAHVRVLADVFEGYAMHDRILTFDFLKYGIYALCIIVTAYAVGYIKFRYFPGNDTL